MGPVGCIFLVVVIILGLYFIYCYVCKNENYKGEKLETNVLDLLFGQGKVSK